MLILAVLFILLVISVFSVSCEQTRVKKLEMLNATSEQLENADTAVIECNLAVKLINDEINKLRELIVKKKIVDLRTCKGKFDAKIEDYKVMYKAVHSRAPTNKDIDDMKRSLGITF
jgi:hypothetical protein